MDVKRLPELETVEKLHLSIDCKQKAVRAVRFNSDGEYCLTCGSDRTIKLWNPHKNIALKTYVGHGNEVLDAQSTCDNAQICSGGLDKSVILWDVATGKMLRKFRGHAAKVDCVSFNEDGAVIMSGSLDGSVQIWDTKSRKLEPIQTLDESKDGISSILGTDHEIFTASTDKHLRRYDLRCGQMTSDFLGAPVMCVSLTMDGQCILTNTSDSTLRLLDKKSGELLNEYKGHTSVGYKIDSAVSSDDKQVLTGSEDGLIYIWDLIKTDVIGRLDHGKGKTLVHSLSYHPTKPILLTACGSDIFLWKTRHAAIS
ncbi:hypothetical protein HELRODRAFT_90106 [Helobdella robusta]|uniref:WD repeat domain-containing protein 83 n=1 Tax=Helobdella robusta TaxID=6412 RepID=T1G7L0_HELRO|nr:hypothetical protein HELRODRAFT_90106 [Helobdella robusta]ESN91953.1 hypothetical protein HELRODRAFT_90106 [Helobdella robusta]